MGQEAVIDEKDAHPTVDELRRYGVSACDEEEWRRIGKHIFRCEDCQILLLELLTEIDQGGAGDQAQ